MDLVHGVRAPHVGPRHRCGHVHTGRLLLGARVPGQTYEDQGRRVLRAGGCTGEGPT